jgi:hypothetical protein
MGEDLVADLSTICFSEKGVDDFESVENNLRQAVMHQKFQQNEALEVRCIAELVQKLSSLFSPADWSALRRKTDGLLQRENVCCNVVEILLCLFSLAS